MFSAQTHSLIDQLNQELLSMKRLIKYTGDSIQLSTFINAMMRGGFCDIIENFGNTSLVFTAKTDDGQEVLREYYIPDAGKSYNLRAFLNTVNDGVETLQTMPAVEDIPLFIELQQFFEALYISVLGAYQADKDIGVYVH